MTAMILYNIWQTINLVLTDSAPPSRKKKRNDGYRVTMPLMVTIFCAHLNGRF